MEVASTMVRSWAALRSEAEMELFRVTKPEQSYLLLSAGATETRTTACIIEAELRSAEHLDTSFAAVARRRATINGRAALIFHDPGGQPIRSTWRTGGSMADFLRLAISITRSLAKIHENGLVHGDVRPDNLLCDGNGKCYFTGFGRSFLQSDRQLGPPEQPSRIRLPYISPELTGRLDLAADTRSDLYSLGISLYELLTDRLPFPARTTGEWIHSHLARPPLPPGRWVSSIPSIVASIVMKLISKPPEDRYQTALGLEFDLISALEGFALGKRVDFELGRADARGSLLVPNRLYGRDRPLGLLVSALDEVRGAGNSKLALIAGPAGIGKSALVRAFRNDVDPERVLFAQGKFDQLHFTSPYTTLISALRDVVKDTAQRRPASDRLISAIKEALGIYGKAISALIPDLENVIGPQPELPTVSPGESAARFNLVLSRFIRVFASPSRPLVLFFDDLQWIDQATLDFLDRAVYEKSIPNLLIVGAYRDNEVHAGHRLSAWLSKAESTINDIEQISLLPLNDEELLALVSDSLGSPRSKIAKLANEVKLRAEGNPLFSTQLLSSLAEAGALSFDAAVQQWSLNRERAGTLLTEGISDLLSWRLDQLSAGGKSAITTMALFGNSVDRRLLSAALETGDVDLALGEAAAAGLITVDGTTVSFFHDRIQEAAYALTPADNRHEKHLALARQMLAAHQGRIDERVFEIVQQFTHALDLIASNEALVVAQLSLTAGMKAEQASAFDAAVEYYETGLRLISRNCDLSDDLKFEFEIRIADCKLISGDPNSSEEILRDLQLRVHGKRKRARVAWSQITLFTALGRFDAAITLCLGFLAEVGVRWSASPTWEEVQGEFAPIADEILAGTISQRVGLPECTDDEALILDVLSAALPPAFFSNDRLVCLILCRMANISHVSGNTASSALGYAYLGMVLGPMFGDFPAGNQFGQVGLALVGDRRYSRFHGRVAMTVAYHVQPYSRPIRSTRGLHRQALSIAQEGGDLTYAGFCTCTTISNLLFAGDGLIAVEKRASEGLEYAKRIGFGLIADILTSQLMMVRSLRGATFELGGLHDGAFAADEFEKRLVETPGMQIAECWHWVRRLQASVFARKFDEALEFAKKAEVLLWTSAGHLEFVEYSFYYSLSLAKAAGKSIPTSEALSMMVRHVAFLETLADNSSETFSGYAAIVKAEMARMEDQPLKALKLFDLAITHAKVQAFPHIEALACEFAAELAELLDLSSTALIYREKCYSAYKKWGANAKLRDFDFTFPREHELSLQDISSTNDQRGAGLDLNSVALSTATVSGEAVQSRMFNSLMSIALENAGARRARLLTPKGSKLHLEAEAVVSGDEISITPGNEFTDNIPSELAWQSMLTQEPISLETATDKKPIGRVKIKGSALFVPLVARGRSVGVLYLENDLYVGAFPPARLSVIKLIAGQVAIAVENASLEEKESLLREVHHRVKNNLQLISSLLSLQASHIDDPKTAELFLESRNRVRSMALVHENLYRAGNFARIAMSGHLNTLCSYLTNAYGTQARSVGLRVEVNDDLELDLNRAISCGLIVNELVSNALKHAFPSGETGNVVVAMSLDDNKQFSLSVRDDGIGLGSEPLSRETLGLQLVHDLVDQLRGCVVFNCARGTSVEIAFAAEHE